MDEVVSDKKIRKTLQFPKGKKFWGEFVREKKIEGCENLTPFFYRFAFASGFKKMEVDGYSDRTLKGYNALFKVQLAFSAYDSLLIGGKSIKHRVKLKSSLYDYSLQNKRLARSLRLNKELMKILIEKTKGSLSEKIKKFSEEKSDDVLPIAAAIRHLVAHGKITATSVDLLLVKNWKQIDKLSITILDFVDGLFYDYVKRVKSQ